MKDRKPTYTLRENYSGKNGWQYRLILGIIALTMLLFSSCQKWDNTEEVSHVSQLPNFEITGGDFLSYIVADSGEYTDQGAKAYSGETSLSVSSYGDVDLTTVGVYIIYYYAENSDGLSAIAERVVAVTNRDVTGNDLSGKYEGTLWSPLTESKVTKVDEKGLYKCTEVLGYPGTEVKGRFVDLGNHVLVLLHGDGDFGAYATTQGSYTLSTLSWTVSLQDDPYNGYDIDVVWSRKEK